MSASLYHSATGMQAPHCMHVIGIGRTGAAYVEALLRTGEIEDHLADPARDASPRMVVDIGDQDMGLPRTTPRRSSSAWSRGASRPTGSSSRPSRCRCRRRRSSSRGMNRTREFLKLEYPRYYWNPNFESYVPKKYKMPKAGEHFPRAVAKGIYANAYYAGERPMDAALRNFVDQIDEGRACRRMVTVCFSLAGGTGSGMVVDLARHLSNVKLGRRIPVIGVGQLPHSGDPGDLPHNPTLYTTLNELDCMLDDDKNAGVTAVWGDLYRSPFTGGFFVVNPEQSWQRLTAYTTTGEEAIRQNFKEMVTNRFVADSLHALRASSTTAATCSARCGRRG